MLLDVVGVGVETKNILNIIKYGCNISSKQPHQSLPYIKYGCNISTQQPHQSLPFYFI